MFAVARPASAPAPPLGRPSVAGESAPVDSPVPTSTPAYAPPVDAPVVAGFDVASGAYGAGNRGLDYGVGAGTEVRVIGAGVVVFSGSVAGALWVTVRHPDGLRSSYGPLADLLVHPAERLGVGTIVGHSGPVLHLGVRDENGYIDPAPLFVIRPRHARLVASRGK